MGQFVSPYVPNTVPTLSNIDAELARFLEDELNRIAVAIDQTSVQAAYGGLWLENSPAPQQSLNTTDQIITAWDNNAPTVPNRVITRDSMGAITDNLTVEESGVYHVIVTTVVEVSNNIFTFTLYRNGVASNISAVADPSNQTAFLSVAVQGLATLTAGDVIDLRGRVQSGTGTIDMVSGFFTLFRVSEKHKAKGFP